MEAEHYQIEIKDCGALRSELIQSRLFDLDDLIALLDVFTAARYNPGLSSNAKRMAEEYEYYIRHIMPVTSIT